MKSEPLGDMILVRFSLSIFDHIQSHQSQSVYSIQSVTLKWNCCQCSCKKIRQIKFYFRDFDLDCNASKYTANSNAISGHNNP